MGCCPMEVYKHVGVWTASLFAYPQHLKQLHVHRKWERRSSTSEGQRSLKARALSPALMVGSYTPLSCLWLGMQ